MEYQDFKFVKKSTCRTTGTVYYSCSHFRAGCQARLIVKDRLVVEKNEHTCVSKLPQQIVDVRREMRDRLHDLAIEQPAASASVLWETVRDEIRQRCGDQPLELVPKLAGASIVTNSRARIYGFDVLRAVEADTTRRVSEKDKRAFLQFNVSETTQDGSVRRMLGFGHPDHIRLLRYPGCTIFIDGTFKMAPPGFAQCLIVMCYDPSVDVYVPVFYVLVDGKDKDMYWNVLNWVIIRTDRRLEPAAVTCDFELALINAVTEQFPQATVVGCLFHLKQALRKKLVDLHIPKEQIADAMTPGKLDVLTVIPVDEIEDKEFVRSVVNDTGAKRKWAEFWSYFRRTWLRRYDPSMWNVSAMTSSGVELVNRTNNPLERYNREFGERFPTPRPSLLTFIDVAKAESLRYVRLLDDVRRGVARPPEHASGVQASVPEAYESFV